MGLIIKDMDAVFNNLVEWITAKTDKITDFNVGSAMRTLSEAIAMQFEEFYYAMKQNTVWAIENSIYDAFSFDMEAATYATGVVTIRYYQPLKQPLQIEKGTVFCTSSGYGYIYYESTEDVVVPEDTTSVDLKVICKSIGTVGNVPAGAITTIVVTNANIESVTNREALTNGTDDETNTERKKRFQNYIKTLARGTADSIVYGTLEVDGVAGAMVDDSYIGYVKVYAHDSDGNLSDELRQAILDNVWNYRAAGIEVEVLPIIKKAIDIELVVVIDDNYDASSYTGMLHTLVTSELNNYLVSENLYMSNLIHAIKNVYDDVVINIVIRKGADTIIEKNELIRAGEIQVTCVNLRDWRY